MDIDVDNSLIKIYIATTSDSFGLPKYKVYPVTKFEYYDFTMDYFTFKIEGVDKDEYKGLLSDLTVAGDAVSSFSDADSKLTAKLFPSGL